MIWVKLAHKCALSWAINCNGKFLERMHYYWNHAYAELNCFLPYKPDEDSIAHIVDCISDDKLQDAAFFAFLRRVAILSAGASISDPAVEQQIKYAVQVLWELLKKSGHLLKQKYARYIANESHLVNSTIEANLSTCLEPQGKYIIK